MSVLRCRALDGRGEVCYLEGTISGQFLGPWDNSAHDSGDRLGGPFAFRGLEMENEEWRPIAGYEGLYEVSNVGRVRRSGPSGRIMAPYPHKQGYPMVKLTGPTGSKGKMIHRLVASAFCPRSSPDRNTVNHIDCNAANNRASNLEWVTQKENIAHAIRLGRKPTKHTWEIIDAIRAEPQRYGVVSALARRFGIPNSRVSAIRLGKAWVRP